MLHPYKEAARATFLGTGVTPTAAPLRELLSMLDGITEWLDGASPHIPSICLQDAVSVHVLYRNVVYTPDAFWEQLALPIVRLRAIWPVSAYGTAQNQETVRLLAQADESGIHLVQQSISGESATVLKTLCFQMDCSDNQTAQTLVRLLCATNWQTNTVVLGTWQDAPFLREQGILMQTDPPGMLCYASARAALTTRELLFSIAFEQKLILWTALLRDGFDPAEFEWIADALADNTLDNRLEWELALWEALDRLHFRIVNNEKAFALFDAGGNRLYFGADSHSAAVRVFLKMLFPLHA